MLQTQETPPEEADLLPQIHESAPEPPGSLRTDREFRILQGPVTALYMRLWQLDFRRSIVRVMGNRGRWHLRFALHWKNVRNIRPRLDEITDLYHGFQAEHSVFAQ